MNKTGWVLAALSAIIIVAAIILFVLPAKTNAPVVDKGINFEPATTSSNGIIVNWPKETGIPVESPLEVEGTAEGSYYFEASFPVSIKDAQGKVLAQAPAQAQGDWTTTAYVPFKVTLTFPPQASGSSGTLVFQNDNPSGDPARDKSYTIPITFK